MGSPFKLHTINMRDEEAETVVDPSSDHQRAVYATATTHVSGRAYKIASALSAIAFAICDLADAIREHGRAS